MNPVQQRRAIEALRAGVPNRDAVRALGSAQPHIEERFVKLLQSEGYSPDEIETLFILIARRLIADGQVPPFEGLYDYTALAKATPPVAI